MSIPNSIHPVDSWQSQLRDVITTGEQLLDILGLDGKAAGYSGASGADFKLKVPRAFVGRMRRGDPHDPLLRQVLTHRDELLTAPGYNRDPVGEVAGNIPHPGILHKYRGRALLIVAGGCAINCRYCFRRHFPYNANRVGRARWPESIARIADDHSIEEVILSGGDPLIATDNSLAELVQQIGAIPHVRRLRVHSRLPVVLPARATQSLAEALVHPRLKTVLVLHCNHARELDDEVDAAVAVLHRAGITLLNQSVLLAGVNDSADALADLSDRLFDSGVLPYYLHLLDRVQGAAHFDVAEDRARQIMAELCARLPGYLVPRLVREVAGASSKISLAASYPPV